MRPALLQRALDAFRRAPLVWTCGLVFLVSMGATGLGLANIETGSVAAVRPWTPLDAVGVTAEPVDRDSRRALHLTAAEHGAIVTSTRANSLAARADLRVGDVIERVDGGRVDGPVTLTHAVQKAGDPKINFTISRAGHRLHRTIDRPRLGA